MASFCVAAAGAEREANRCAFDAGSWEGTVDNLRETFHTILARGFIEGRAHTIVYQSIYTAKRIGSMEEPGKLRLFAFFTQHDLPCKEFPSTARSIQ